MIDILEKIKTSDKPVTHVVQKSEHFKVISIGLKKGTTLKKHKAPGRARLYNVKGKVEYRSDRANVTLFPFEKYDIPLNEFHELVGLEDSVCLLIVG